MQVHFGLDLLQPEWTRAIACIGTFDGVHLGHRQVIGSAVARARDRGLPALAITFDRHPAAVLAPEKCPLAVASLADNLRQFEGLGIAATVVLPFTRELANTGAQEFLDQVIRGAVRAEALVLGYDFAFGHDRVGNAEWLSSRIETEVVPAFEWDGVRVSSSAVRRAVSEGRVEDAAGWLGRPFRIEGVVIHGAQLGRKLGYPTANLARSFRQLEPADAVYAGEATTLRGRFRAAISVGLRPTIDATSRTIEAYLLDYGGEALYGTPLSLDFERKLRDQAKFDSLEALKEQMARDVQAVRTKE